MPTYKVPASAIPSGGFAVPENCDIVDFSLLSQLVVVDAEAGTARLGSASGTIVAHWGDSVSRINGTTRNDLMIGDDDGGMLVGGNGHDTFEDDELATVASRTYGGNGNDIFYLEGASGTRADGGEGNDRFFLTDGAKANIYGGNGTDTLTYRDTDDGADERVVVDLRAGHSVVTVDGVNVGSVSGVEWVYTDSGKDIFYGDAAANRFMGNDGADHLHGLAGNDVLIGGAGNDHLNGGYGNDVMNGGTGNDYFAGGFNVDTFRFDTVTAGEVDTISIVGRLDTLDFRGAVGSLNDLEIVIDDSDPLNKTATIEIDVGGGGVHTIVIEKLLSALTLTDELAQHVLVG